MKYFILVGLLLATEISFSNDIFGLSNLDKTELMSAYWQCDVLSDKVINNNPVDGKSMAVCASVSSEVRKRFFNDDFVSYLKWVNNNKDRTIRINPF
jgi:hypothetical protein